MHNDNPWAPQTTDHTPAKHRRRRSGRRCHDGRWQPSAPDGTSRSASLYLRLSLVLVVGTALTVLGVQWTRVLPATSPAPAAAPAEPATPAYSDPPWTVPLPRASPTPTSGSPKRIRLDRSIRSPAPRRSTAPSSPKPQRPTTTPNRFPQLLGPANDAGLQPGLTSYCQHVRGFSAVARTMPGSPDGWGCQRDSSTQSLRVAAACRWHFGADAWASQLDNANPYSWRCYRS